MHRIRKETNIWTNVLEEQSTYSSLQFFRCHVKLLTVTCITINLIYFQTLILEKEIRKLKNKPKESDQTAFTYNLWMWTWSMKEHFLEKWQKKIIKTSAIWTVQAMMSRVPKLFVRSIAISLSLYPNASYYFKKKLKDQGYWDLNGKTWGLPSS